MDCSSQQARPGLAGGVICNAMLLTSRLTLLHHHVSEGIAMLLGAVIPQQLHLAQRPLAFAQEGLCGPGHEIDMAGRTGTLGRGIGGSVVQGNGASGDDVPEGPDEEVFGIDCHHQDAADGTR